MQKYLFLIAFALLISGCDNSPMLSSQLGGETTLAHKDKRALLNRIQHMNPQQRSDFQLGRSFFAQPWVIAPSATTDRDGLGPLFNANACSACHKNNGQGHAPDEGDTSSLSLLLRLSTPTADTQNIPNGSLPHVKFGGQLQDKSIPGIEAESQISVKYIYTIKTLADGTQVELRKPQWSLSGEVQDFQHSARIAPRLVGMGLLDQIDKEDIQSWADPSDKDNDGISGRAARVYDYRDQQWTLGRYGWKAEAPNLIQQTAAAFQGDMGISSSIYSMQNCTPLQPECLQKPTGGKIEIENYLLDAVTFYVGHLSVPAARNFETSTVQQGWKTFQSLQCQQCHRSNLRTSSGDGLLNNQTISPFSDLLLHDMGLELSDQRPVNNASGNEWRTAPLWGIGLAATIANGQPVGFLHDGRARTIEEAILWHGGEAAKHNQAYQQLKSGERKALLAFLLAI